MSIQKIADELEAKFGSQYTRKQYFSAAKYSLKTVKRRNFSLGKRHYLPRPFDYFN